MYQIQAPDLIQLILRAGWRQPSTQDTERCKHFLRDTAPFNTQEWNTEALNVVICFFGLSLALPCPPDAEGLPLGVRFVPQVGTEGAIDLAVCERVRQATGEAATVVGVVNVLDGRFYLSDESLLWVLVVTESSSWYLVAAQLEFVGNGTEEALRSLMCDVNERRRVVFEPGIGSSW
ncbi:MAG: hypothetical protein JNK05_39135 [Myxococcales bacterium]|nr:hypothetical protein [Myxococcales bacterium]